MGGEEGSTTDHVCKTKACLDDLTSLRTIIQAQAKKIELLEEKLSQLNINQKEEDPNGVENRNKKRKRDISGIQSIMNASIIEDSSNKDIEISALNEENKLKKEEDDNPNSKVASSVTYANIVGESQSESTPTS